MRIVIVGGNSSLSQSLLPSLGSWCEVITAGRSNCDLHVDLASSLEEMEFPDQVDLVINTASHFGGSSGTSLLEAEMINVAGTLKLCEKSRRAGVQHFIYISSVFSGLAHVAGKATSYALSKKHAEEAVQFYCASYGIPFTILKPSQLYGAQPGFAKHQPFFYTLLDHAQRGENITLYGSHDPLRNYLYIDDLVTIINRVIHSRVIGNFQCAHPKDVSYSAIAHAAYAAFGSQGEVIFLSEKENIQDNVFEKEDELYKKIGFYPQISIEEGIKKIADYRTLTK